MLPLLFGLWLLCLVYSDPSVVTIPDGTMKGVVRPKSRFFKAIPYAQPPVADLRWRPPKENKPWTGVLDATEFPPSCLQGPFTPPITNISENCLYLNVYAPLPPSNPSTLYPVMVYIHGGGFTGGGSNESRLNGTYLVERYTGMIVVTLNYRLGVFGFLGSDSLRSRDAGNSTGNYGTQDQTLALRWVQKNIKYFNGNPGDVTVSGESAGAASTAIHLVSKQSWGLFHKAIASSGATASWDAYRMSTAEHRFNNIAKSTLCHNSDPTKTIDCLLKKDGKFLSDLTRVSVPGCQGTAEWGPVIDGVILTEQPWQLAEKGQFPKVPMLMGTNHDEGASFSELGNHHLKKLELDLWKAAAFGKTVQQNLTELYTTSKYPGTSYYSSYWKLGESIATDGIMACANRRLARWMTQRGNDAWLYQFAHGPNGTHIVPHACDIPFFFHVDTLLPQPADLQVSDTLSGYWANFVKTSDPNKGAKLPLFPKYSMEDDVTQIVNVTTYSHKHYKADTCAFWDSILSYETTCRPLNPACQVCPPTP